MVPFLVVSKSTLEIHYPFAIISMNKAQKLTYFFLALFLGLLVFVPTAQGQQNDEAIPQASIRVMARAVKDTIKLRWAVDQPLAWQRANSYGFSIQRFTVYRDGVLLDKPEKTQINPLPIKPMPLAAWESYTMQNDQAAIIAQALYGDDFEMEMEQGELIEIVNQAKILDQRFSFALFAADMDFTAAKMAGWAWEDATVLPNEDYVYQINAWVPTEVQPIQEASVFVRSSDTQALPQPMDLAALFRDRSVMLTWEYEMLKAQYTGYFVERALENGPFTRVADQPIVNLNDKEDMPAKRMYFLDSLPGNNTTYRYRVQGISPFGELGPYSDPIEGQGEKAFTVSPVLTHHNLLPSGGAEVFWEFPKKAETEIQEFRILAAANNSGPYDTIQKGIAKNLRKTELTNLEGSNYIKLIAFGGLRKQTSSATTLVQMVDSIPPTAPKELQASIDSLGMVRLQWVPNTESDLLGYRLFRAQTEEEEFSPITEKYLSANQTLDTVSIKSLNSRVFYKLVALDKRYNQSDYSETLVVVKPDVIAPIAPVFTDYKVTETGIQLQWVPSHSSDVVSYNLYRSMPSDSVDTWQLRKKLDRDQTEFLDEVWDADTLYEYRIEAEDQAGNKSAESPGITLRSPLRVVKKSIRGLAHQLDYERNQIRLSWKLDPAIYQEVLIYNKTDDGQPHLWRQLPGYTQEQIDTQVHPGSRYTYFFKPMENSGRTGKTEQIRLNF
jgi:hypothetical protein